jgi:hypothetical protein
MKHGRLIFYAVLGVIAAVTLYSCYLSPKAQVKRAVYGARDAVEAQDMAAIEALIADDFRDPFGFTKEQWLPVIRVSFGEWKDIKLRFLDLQIEIKNGRATAKFTVNGEATRAESLGGDKAPDREAYTFRDITLQLDQRGGEWKVTSWTNINSQTWQVPMPEVNP